MPMRSAHLLAEARALAGVHELARSKEWKAVIRRLVGADQVSVASFQHSTFEQVARNNKGRQHFPWAQAKAKNSSSQLCER